VALNGGDWSVSRSGCFTPVVKASGTNWIGGWVCSKGSNMMMMMMMMMNTEFLLIQTNANRGVITEIVFCCIFQ